MLLSVVVVAIIIEKEGKYLEHIYFYNAFIFPYIPPRPLTTNTPHMGVRGSV